MQGGATPSCAKKVMLSDLNPKRFGYSPPLLDKGGGISNEGVVNINLGSLVTNFLL